MEVGKGPGGPFGAGLRRVLGWAQGWHLVLEAVARLGGDTRRWHSPGAGWGAPEPELPRGSFTCPVPVLPPRFPPPHPPPRPPPASQIFFFFFFSGGCWQAAGLFGRNINGSRRSRRCPGTSSPKGEEGEGERERGETREPSLGEGGHSPPAPSPWFPPNPWHHGLGTPVPAPFFHHP